MAISDAMEKGTFKFPKLGKSRLAKILPVTPPAAKHKELPPRQHGQQQKPLPLPQKKPSLTRKPVPSAVPLPPPPPPAKEATKSKPLPSSPPPVPLKPGQQTSSIKRRPLASARQPSPALTETSPLSSVLSAYSDHSDSASRSSTDSATLPVQELLVPTSLGRPDSFIPPLSALIDSYVDDDDDCEPSDLQKPAEDSRNQSSHDGVSRQRSIESDRTLTLTGPKLDSSNGASSADVSPTLPPFPLPPRTLHESAPSSGKSLPTQPVLAANSTSGMSPNASTELPGRDARLVAIEKQEAPQSSEKTGQEASYISRSSESPITISPNKGSPVVSQIAAAPERTQPRLYDTKLSQIPRLPTPEYDIGDIGNPVVETIISPVSPTSTPKLQPEAKPSSATQEDRVFENRERSYAKPTTGLGLEYTPPPVPAADGELATSNNKNSFPTRTSSRPRKLPKASGNLDLHAPAGSRAGSHDAGPRVTPKTTVEDARAVEARQTKPASVEMPETTATSQSQSAGQEEPESDLGSEAPGKEDPETGSVYHPALELFPRGWGDSVPDDTIFDARPVGERNLRCLTGHRLMPQSRNVHYPLACQACRVKDTSARHTCGSCWLRVCTTCRNSLHNKFGGNLRALMEHNEAVLVEHVDESQAERAGLEITLR